MKKIALTFFGLALVAFAVAQQFAFRHTIENVLNPDKASFTWNTTSFDFGKILQNVPVSHEFTFKNSGSVPLIITSVKASCGCTVTSYSSEPIQPGASGFVKATYNAAKIGQFQKPITVNANADEGVVTLTITGEVTE
jgi:hypothetical protein